ncbi:MAG: 2-phospho-L-lactate guanylyltransferase [Phototrophicales bacterium]|nr:MAG: 2-phospho-L-lactate guanylyltransferase [Phototrophicales bacterium]
MSVWVIIPVKPLRLAKSRLSKIFTPEEREQFAEAMLRHVLKVVQDVSLVAGTLVISRDNHALALAREYNAKTIQESGAPELNAALMRATSIVASWRAEAVLILPADLPLIQPEDIVNIINMGSGTHPCVVISTDRNKDGTNALYVQPPGLISYAYGAESFQRHAVMARDAGADVLIYQSDRMLQDIDLPEDIENYQRMIQRGDYEDTIKKEIKL